MNNWTPLIDKELHAPAASRMSLVVQREHAALDNWGTIRSITNLLTTRAAGNHYSAACII